MATQRLSGHMDPSGEFKGCFGCGQENAVGLGLEFVEIEGSVAAETSIDRRYAGYADFVHGGVVATLLDEAMGWALWVLAKKSGVTQTLNITYKRPVYVERCVRISSWLDTGAPANSPMKVHARIEDERGRVLAEASGDWVIVRDQRRAAPAV